MNNFITKIQTFFYCKSKVKKESVRECYALLNNIVLQDHIHDKWKWLLGPIQGYSVRGTYHFLTLADKPMDRGLIHNVWYKQVPSKVSLFPWRLLRDRIPTKNNLVRRCVLQPNDNLCVGGCGLIETAYHLFIICDIFRSIWYLVWQWFAITSVSSGTICDHYAQFTHIWRVCCDFHIIF